MTTWEEIFDAKASMMDASVLDASTLDVEHYTWPEGEALAQVSGSEVVGLGFYGVQRLVYVQLTNIADPAVWDRRFSVSGEEIQDVIRRMGSAPVALWHSHRKLSGPSETDLEVFPEDIVLVGCVYHVPSESTILYNENGVITGDSEIQAAPFVTGETS